MPIYSKTHYSGCPWLIVNQQDTNYFFDNNLLHKSQLPENQGQFITDKYILKTKPGIFDNKFKLDIVETSLDSTVINSIKLYQVEHPAGTILGITPDNQIVYFDSASVIQTDYSSLFDPDYNYTDITSDIQFHNRPIEGSNVEGDSLYHIFSEFKNSTITNPAIIAYMKRGVTVPINPGVKDNYSGNININSPNGVTQYPFMRRENPDILIIPHDEGTSQGSVDSIHIAWDKSFIIKYAAVASLDYNSAGGITELPLVTAFHTSDGDVLYKLSSNDSIYTYVSAGAYLNLEFSTTPLLSPSSITDYVLEINGQVIAIGSKNKLTSKLKNTNPNSISLTYSLSQNYPNPFNPTTKISFALPKAGFVTLKIYDILGREIKTLVNEIRQDGNYSVDFNASEFSSGVYFYRIQANDFTDVKRMLLVK